MSIPSRELLSYQRMKMVEIIEDFVDWQEEGSREDQIDALNSVVELLDTLLQDQH